MKKGELVSNAEVLSLLENAMKKVASSKGFLIDGYPRQKDQGAAFEQAISPVDLILYFECRDVSEICNFYLIYQRYQDFLLFVGNYGGSCSS